MSALNLLKRRFKLRSKITFSIVSIILFFGLLATLLVFILTFNNAKSEKKLNILNGTVAQSGDLEQAFSNSKFLVETLSRNPKIVTYLLNPNDLIAQEPIKAGLLYEFNINQMYSAIYLIDKNGITLASTDTTFIGNNYSFRDYFIKAMEGVSYVDISIGITSNQLGYYFSAPVKNKDEIIGVVVLKQLPNFIHDHVLANSIVDKTMLVDSNGVVVFSDDYQRIFSSLGKLDDYLRDELKRKQKFSNYEIKPLSYDLIQNELSSLSKPQIYDFFDELDGESELLAVSKIGQYPFYVVTETEIENIIKQTIVAASSLGVLVLAAAMVATILLSYFVGRFLTPINKLVSITQKVSEGDLTHTLEVNSKDELEDLANSFNHMTRVLRDTLETIEQKIKERTTNLEKLNSLMVGRELKMVELKKEISKLQMALEKKENSSKN